MLFSHLSDFANFLGKLQLNDRLQMCSQVLKLCIMCLNRIVCSYICCFYKDILLQSTIFCKTLYYQWLSRSFKIVFNWFLFKYK